MSYMMAIYKRRSRSKGTKACVIIPLFCSTTFVLLSLSSHLRSEGNGSISNEHVMREIDPLVDLSDKTTNMKLYLTIENGKIQMEDSNTDNRTMGAGVIPKLQATSNSIRENHRIHIKATIENTHDDHLKGTIRIQPRSKEGMPYPKGVSDFVRIANDRNDERFSNTSGTRLYNIIGNRTNTNLTGSRPTPCVRIGVFAALNSGRWRGGYVCPETECYVEVVQSQRYIVHKDVHALFIPPSSLPLFDFEYLSRYRSPNQVWIFNSFESPVHTTLLGSKWARTGFNWTFTYRTDATFPSPYGRYNPGSPLVAKDDATNWAKGKTKVAAWIGSNCFNTQWPRIDFVRKLQKYIPLDTYGLCGTKTCPKSSKCGETLIKYKFYLALENSECQDYITEKFWRAPFKNNMVPVVYGPPKTDYEKVAPPKSFIHIDDFKTIKELGDYLTLLDQNDTLYNEYFEWKKHGFVEMDLIGEYYISRKVMCRIASRIVQRRNEQNIEPETVDMKTWWTDSCETRKNMKMLMKA